MNKANFFEMHESIIHVDQLDEGAKGDGADIGNSHSQPVMSYGQRKRASIRMHARSAKIHRARDRAYKRRATQDVIVKRAKRLAHNVIRRFFLKGKKLEDLTTQERIALDKRMSRIPRSVYIRIAKRLIPVVRKLESARLARMTNKTGASEEAIKKTIPSEAKYKGDNNAKL